MGVDADELLPKGVAEDNVGGFLRHRGESGDRRAGPAPGRRSAAPVLTAILNRFGFVAVEIYLANLLLKSRQDVLT